MRTEIYQWMKNLTLFYVLFQAALQLVPDKKYEKYVRFYMGLLLIMLMLSPVFILFGKSEELWADFGEFYQKEDLKRLQKEAENLENYYLMAEQAWETEMEEQLEKLEENMKVQTEEIKLSPENGIENIEDTEDSARR